MYTRMWTSSRSLVLSHLSRSRFSTHISVRSGVKPQQYLSKRSWTYTNTQREHTSSHTHTHTHSDWQCEVNLLFMLKLNLVLCCTVCTCTRILEKKQPQVKHINTLENQAVECSSILIWKKWLTEWLSVRLMWFISYCWDINTLRHNKPHIFFRSVKGFGCLCVCSLCVCMWVLWLLVLLHIWETSMCNHGGVCIFALQWSSTSIVSSHLCGDFSPSCHFHLPHCNTLMLGLVQQSCGEWANIYLDCHHAPASFREMQDVELCCGWNWHIKKLMCVVFVLGTNCNQMLARSIYVGLEVHSAVSSPVSLQNVFPIILSFIFLFQSSVSNFLLCVFISGWYAVIQLWY